jgi:diguanylate cyclase (GGDEF)-like protein
MEVTGIRRVCSSPTSRVLVLAAAMAGSAGLLQLLLLARPASPLGHAEYPILALVIGFALAECMVVHLEFRREVHSISMSELPLVLGLMLFTPGQVLPARLLGAVIALLLHRRQLNVKLVFNLGNFALEAALAATLYIGLLGNHPVFSLAGAGAALISTLAANLVCGGAVLAAVAVHDNRISRNMFLRVIGAAGVSCVANTSLGLVAAAVVVHEPVLALPLVGLLGLAYLGFRAHAALRERYKGLELIYGFTQSIGNLHRSDDGTAVVLGKAADLLRAERAEILLLDADGGVGTVTSLTPDGVATSAIADLDGSHNLELLAMCADRAVLAARTTKDPDLSRRLEAAEHKDALVTPLRRGDQVVGAFLVADRLGHVSTFDVEDMKLFETVAVQTASMLENGHLIDRLRREAASKEYLSLHDPLTGLANRTLFHELVMATIDTGITCAAVMLMDLDRFKEVNDTLGHHTGDRLLVEISTRLSEALDGRGEVARLGGDEFAIFIQPVADVEGAEAIAGQIRSALERPFELDGLTIEIGASIGVAMYPAHADDSSTLLQRADVAMYRAKTSRLGHAVYVAERDPSNPRRLSLAAELRHAIERGEVTVHYQPQAALATGQITGVEALVRWTHPRYGSLPPDEFIPVAEHTGLIRPLTELVLKHALGQCRLWCDLGVELTVAVNLSARSLIDTDLAGSIAHLLDQAGVPARLLTLEITESMLMADPVRALETLQQLASMGIILSIDDFGTGYSSLSKLKELPVHEIKIDRSFVQTMTIDEDDATIVRSIVDLARNLRLRVVAEGVEDGPSLDALTDLGCESVQGYYLSRAVSASVFTANLLERGTSLSAWVRPRSRLSGPVGHPLRLLSSTTPVAPGA